MASAKSASLISAEYNYRSRGLSTLVFKPAFDNRDSSDPEIVSRTGLRLACHYAPATYDALTVLTDAVTFDVIFVDEVQFLTLGQIESIAALARARNVPLLCYGLRNAYDGGGFPVSDWLLRHADKLIGMKSVCWCGSNATHNALVLDGKVYKETLSEGNMVVGGDELYHTLCLNHFIAGQLKP